MALSFCLYALVIYCLGFKALPTEGARCSQSNLKDCLSPFRKFTLSTETFRYYNHSAIRGDLCSRFDDFKQCVQPFLTSCPPKREVVITGLVNAYTYACGPEGVTSKFYATHMACLGSELLRARLRRCKNEASDELDRREKEMATHLLFQDMDLAFPFDFCGIASDMVECVDQAMARKCSAMRDWQHYISMLLLTPALTYNGCSLSTVTAFQGSSQSPTYGLFPTTFGPPTESPGQFASTSPGLDTTNTASTEFLSSSTLPSSSSVFKSFFSSSWPSSSAMSSLSTIMSTEPSPVSESSSSSVSATTLSYSPRTETSSITVKTSRSTAATTTTTATTTTATTTTVEESIETTSTSGEPHEAESQVSFPAATVGGAVGGVVVLVAIAILLFCLIKRRSNKASQLGSSGNAAEPAPIAVILPPNYRPESAYASDPPLSARAPSMSKTSSIYQGQPPPYDYINEQSSGNTNSNYGHTGSNPTYEFNDNNGITPNNGSEAYQDLTANSSSHQYESVDL